MSSRPDSDAAQADTNIVRLPAARSISSGDINASSIAAVLNRIQPYIRHTPVMHAWLPSMTSSTPTPVILKLENLQHAGSVDIRGALNFALCLPREQRERGLVTASWGNVGLALAYVGHRLEVPVTVYLSGPATTHEKLAMLERWGAKVVIDGDTWVTTHRSARAFAESSSKAYLHPFADARLVEGNATVGVEILADVPNALSVLIPGDGGGITVSGVALAAKSANPAIEVRGVEVDRVSRLHHCLRTGRLTNFPTGRAYLGPPRLGRVSFDLVRPYVTEVVLVTDVERLEALRVLWNELELSVGPFGATAVAAALCSRLPPTSGPPVCLVGASGEDGLF